MRILTVAAGAFILSASTAFAWQSHYDNGVVTGFQPNNPNTNFRMTAYPTANFCPAGLSPVSIGGVICCGVPNAAPDPVYHPRPKHKPQGTYVAYGKGAGDGYVDKGYRN